MEQPVVGPQGPSQDGMYGSRRSRLQKVDSKLSAHMDSEDRRVKELTEGILYDFLPAALNVMLPRCEDPLQELDADRCRAVASAALAVSALMNAPPGFLEFLLCVPWRKLSQLYPKSDSIDKLVSNLQVTDEERRKLVNTRIDPALMATALDFLYKEKHADSVPPMLQLTPVSPLQPDDKTAPQVVRETVAAVLDGATPLHCAALRGNPAQVDHLLFCGADPTLRTAAGELPIELVPVCGDRAGAAPGQRNCRCMGPHDQEVWECRSRLARSLIARRCFFSFGVGLFSWLRLVLFCLLCLLGQAGRHTSISRPVVERHIDTRRQQKVAAARARAHALVARMRSEAEAGHRHLAEAKRECRESAAFQKGPPDISTMCFTDPTKSPPPPPPQFSQIHDINFHLQESGTSSTGEELPSEKAFKCFVRSVHALQSLDLHGDTVPQVFAELVAAGGAEGRETHVLEDEQADLYSCWAESVLLKFRGCTCPGCAALAIQAVRMAHIQATRLFGKVDRVKATHAERWQAVGQALARVVYVHICLLLETEAQGSPTRSLVWRAEQCLREWDRLERAGLTQGAGVLDPRHVAALQLWAKTADSDLYIAEALHGQGLPPTKTLQEVVLGAVSYTSDGAPILARTVSSEVVASLEQAITLASLPSPLLAHIVRGVVANAAAELAAAARLRELVGAKGAAALGGGGTTDAVAALSEALRAAEPFRSRLGPELEAALELRSKWTHRAMAVEKLEGAVEEVRAYTTAYPLSFSMAGAAGSRSPSASGRKVAASTAAVDGTGGRGGPADGGAGERGGGPAGGQPTAVAAAAAAAAAVDVTPAAAAGTGGAGGGGGTGSGGGGGGDAVSSGPGPGGGAAGGDGAVQAQAAAPPPDLAEWDRRMKQLELAMNDAKDANVSVTKAKRLHKEMAAVATAAEASRHLEAVMARRPSGPLQLKMALNRAEAAASALSGLGGPPVPGLAEVLGPLMAAARRRLDTERAAEALSKAAVSYRTLGDLGRLEAAIYNAKKIGAEELDPESYRTSLELRAHLQEAARGRTALETALRNLQNQLRSEDAEALERALQDASRWEDLLAADSAKARKALEQWRVMTVAEAKLARLLREGATTSVLARAIQEAAASGVKVQHAKRVLKLMQALEAVLTASAVDVSGAAERYTQVKAKLEAAEQGGVTAGPLPEAARRTMARLSALTAREALEAALKPHSDWSMAQRIVVLREALYKAEGVLGPPPAAVAAAAAMASKAGCGGEGGGQPGTSAAGGKGEGQPQHSQAGQQQQPKLANGSAAGKTSRRKRSSGGGTANAAEAAAAPPPPPVAAQDDASSTPLSLSCRSSNAGGSTSSGSNSGSSSAGAAVGGEEDEVLQTVRDLARKARLVLEEDQAEVARIERERQEAERARKEAQERERQERLRLEQERQRREKAEAAERERALAEKREKAKAEKNRQHQQQHPKGKPAAASAAVAAEVSSAAAPAGAGAGEKPSGGGGKGGGGGGRQGGGGSGGKGSSAHTAAPPAPTQPSAAAGSAQGPHSRSHGAHTGHGKASAAAAAARDVPPAMASAAASPAHSSAAAQQQQQQPAPAPTAVRDLQPAQVSKPPPEAVAPEPVATATAAVVATVAAPAGYLGGAGQAVCAAAFPGPTHLACDGVAVDVQTLLGLLPSTACGAISVGATGPMLVAAGGGAGGAAPVAVHSRGDSLESLGEVVHKLNREVIEALDMDNDAVLTHDTLSPLTASAIGVGEGAAAQAAGGPMMGAAAAGGGGLASTATQYSGGGSFGRAGSGAAATADSTMDQTPSQRTSSIMSSVASADDVMLQGTGSTNVGGAGGVMSGGGAACLSTISSGQPSGGGGGGGGSVNAAADMPSLSLSASACVVDGAMLGAPGVSTVTAGGAGGGGGGGLGTASKPRFGFVDLGGASWGLDSPLLTGAGGVASLFPSLQSSITDFGGMLGTPKPDATAAAAGGGWPTGPLGAGAAAPGAMLFSPGAAAGQHAAAGAAGPGASSVGGADDRRQLGPGAAGGGGASSTPPGALLVGPGGGACLGSLQIHTSDSGMGGLAVGVLTSPRTTVATASAGMHGLLHVRPLGAGGAPASAAGLTQLPGLMVPGASAGRPSLHLQLQAAAGAQSAAGGSGGGGIGVAARSGFWTPPSFQQATAAAAGSDLSAPEAGGGVGPGGGGAAVGVGMGMHHLSIGHGGGGAGISAAGAGLELVDWQAAQQQQGDLAGGALQVLHLGPGCTAPCSQVVRPAASNPSGSASRICRFYLQGFCRDGERCRFAHVTPLAAVSGTPTAGGAAAAAASAQLQLQGQLLVSPGGGGGGAGAFGGATGHGSSGGGGGGVVVPSSVAQNKTVGSFAFGAPGAEAFAPLGSASMGRHAASISHGTEPAGTDLLLSRASAPQLRQGMALGGGGGASLGMGMGLDRSQLSSHSAPGPAVSNGLPGTAAGGGGGGGGSGGVLMGVHQQAVQLRDSATGATFAAVLTPVVGAAALGLQQNHTHTQTHQQPLLLSLPDDLTFSPPSSSATPSSSGGSAMGQARK